MAMMIRAIIRMAEITPSTAVMLKILEGIFILSGLVKVTSVVARVLGMAGFSGKDLINNGLFPEPRSLVSYAGFVVGSDVDDVDIGAGVFDFSGKDLINNGVPLLPARSSEPKSPDAKSPEPGSPVL